MASEIRANKQTNRVGLGTVTYTDTGIIVSGIVTANSFKGDGSSLTGIDATALKDTGGAVKIQAQASGAVYTGIHTFSSAIDIGSNIKIGNAGVVTATSFTGSGANLTSLPAANLTGTLPAISGANLTGLASREVYGFTGIGNSLSLTHTNNGADNITNATYVAFEESFIGPSGISFSINTSGNLIMTV